MPELHFSGGKLSKLLFRFIYWHPQ